MKTLIFIENLVGDLPQGDNLYISLSPKASVQLEKMGISYQILKNFYSFEKRKNDIERFTRSFFEWVDQCDEALQRQIKNDRFKKVRFFRLSGYYVKLWVENHIIFSKNLLAAVEACNPDEVIYMGGEKKESVFDFQSFFYKKDISNRILPLICSQKNIPYKEYIPDTEKTAKSFLIPNFKETFHRILRWVRTIIHVFWGSFSYNSQKSKRFAILREDWIHDFCAQARVRGDKVFWATPEGLRQALFSTDPAYTISHNKLDNDLFEEWKNVKNNFMREFSFAQWPSLETGIEFQPILKEGFVFLIEKIFPIIQRVIVQYAGLFKKHKIDALVMAYKISPFEIGVVAAAQDAGIKIIQIEHGSSETYDVIWEFTEQPCDLYVANSPEEREFFKGFFKKMANGKTSVMSANVWTLKHIRMRRSFQKIKSNVRKTIVYIPSFQHIARWSSTYPIPWYFEFQKELVKYFMTRNDIDFVVKSHPALGAMMGPLKEWASLKGASNVVFWEIPLLKALKRADAAISDFSSTATFEARLLGIPTLSLCHSLLLVRPQAESYYGHTIKIINTSQEAVQCVDQFVADIKNYVCNVDEIICQPGLYAQVMNYLRNGKQNEFSLKFASID